MIPAGATVRSCLTHRIGLRPGQQHAHEAPRRAQHPQPPQAHRHHHHPGTTAARRSRPTHFLSLRCRGAEGAVTRVQQAGDNEVRGRRALGKQLHPASSSFPHLRWQQVTRGAPPSQYVLPRAAHSPLSPPAHRRCRGLTRAFLAPFCCPSPPACWPIPHAGPTGTGPGPRALLLPLTLSPAVTQASHPPVPLLPS